MMKSSQQKTLKTRKNGMYKIRNHSTMLLGHYDSEPCIAALKRLRNHKAFRSHTANLLVLKRNADVKFSSFSS